MDSQSQQHETPGREGRKEGRWREMTEERNEEKGWEVKGGEGKLGKGVNAGGGRKAGRKEGTSAPPACVIVFVSTRMKS
jgi:hypothetical protein